MKQCPACNRVYTDETLIYCLADGSLLAAKFDSDATQILPAHELPTVVAAPPTVASPKPAPTSPPTLPYSPTPMASPTPPARQGVSPAVVYVLIALLALVVGAGAMLLLRPGSTANQPSPSPTPAPTQQTELGKNGDGTASKEQTKHENDNLSSPSSTPRPIPTETTRPSGLPGSYPEASSRYLNDNDLYSKSCFELLIMRNEIFARHGYIFNTADMRSYFSQQSWYRPQAANVAGSLSEIEKSNAQVIKQHENSKGCR